MKPRMPRRLLATVLTLLMLVSAIPLMASAEKVVENTTVYTFDDADEISGWTVWNNAVTITDGKLSAYGTGNTAALGAMTDVVVADGTVSAEVSASSERGAGLIFRAQDKSNFLHFRLANYTQVQLYEFASTGNKNLKSVDFAWSKNTTYTLTVEMHGSAITCYVDGEKLIDNFTITNSKFTASGMVGVRSYQAMTLLDDFTVTTETAITPTATKKIEAEGHGTYLGEDSVGVVEFNRGGDATWSGGKFVFYNQEKGTADALPNWGASFTLTADKTGKYDVAICYKDGDGRGIWDVYKDGIKLDQIDMYGKGAFVTRVLEDVVFDTDTVTLDFVCVGLNDQSTRYNYGMAVDYFTLSQYDTLPKANEWAHETVGSVKVEGDGYLQVAAGTTYGQDTTLTADALTYGKDSTFVGWLVNGVFYNAETMPVLTVAATKAEKVTAYFLKANESLVVYYGKANRVVDARIVRAGDTPEMPDIPAVQGFQAGVWDTDAESLAIAVAQTPGEIINVTAGYAVDDYAATYTVTPTDCTVVQGMMDFGFDSRVDLTAEATLAGVPFSHWEVDGVPAAYGELTYSFYVGGNHEVKAVYAANITPAPAVGIQQAYSVEQGSKYKVMMIAGTYLPEGYTLLDYGMYFARNQEDLENPAAVTDGRVLKVVSSLRKPNHQYLTYLNGVNDGVTRCGRAYMTLRDNTGAVSVVYSDIATVVAGQYERSDRQ